MLDSGDPGEAESALEALCEQHPGYADALRRLALKVRRGSKATNAVPGADASDRPRIGRYELQGEIGRGGFGVVYRAEQHEPLRRSVAVKVLAPGMDASSVHARFEAERQILARLAHPHIAEIHDAGTTDTGSLWFAMELIDGPPITDWARREQPDLDGLLRLFLQVCEAVQHAHQRGVIHRDLKPANVLVSTVDGQPFAKVIDFGIAKARSDDSTGEGATVDGSLIGTPEYMSPEQALGKPADTRSDVYGLGGLLYRLLTGSAPRSSETSGDLAALQQDAITRDPKRPSQQVASDTGARATELRGNLDWISLTALRRDPDDRYASVAEFANDLRRHLDGRPILARPPSLGYLIATTWRRHRTRFLLASAAAVLVVSAAIGMTLLWIEAREQERLAGQRAEQLDKSFADLQRVTDPLRAAARSEFAERELWPALPVRLPDFDRWLEEVQPLAERLATTAPDAPERQRLLSTIREVEQRKRTATDVARVTRDTADIWRQAQFVIRTDSRFGDFELPVIPGLLPIGTDPETGFVEFAHLLSGVPLGRDDQDRLVPAPEHGLILVLLPGGEADIGAQSDDAGAPRFDPDAAENEGPVHTVSLAPFLISKWEMTQAQWKRLAGSNPSKWDDGVAIRGRKYSLLHPVEQITWDAAVRVLQRAGLDLPTESAWEYAARAGSDHPWLGADDAVALAKRENIADTSYGAAHYRGASFDDGAEDGWAMHAPIGSFSPNRFGLFDMLGNVFEWTASTLGGYEVPTNGVRGERPVTAAAPHTRDQRVFRGGAHSTVARIGRVSRRSLAPADTRSSTVGVRPCLWIQIDD